MITAGVDLAAEAAGSAVAVVEWGPGSARLTSMVLGADDAAIVAAVGGADRTGVDVPVGWPSAFVATVVAHHEFRLPPPASSDRAWRRALTLRATDEFVHAATGLMPLSVAADRIAHPALRWAAVAARLAADGVDVRRDGSGAAGEVYPAAALKLWGLPYRRYKRAADAAARSNLVVALRNAAPWLDLGPHTELCCRSDDALDAVVCALVARAVALGGIVSVPDQASALTEGWIHLPTGALGDLV